MTPLGEVVAATTTQWTAQCIDVPRGDEIGRLPDPPPFGALVRVGPGTETLALPVDWDPFETRPQPPALHASGEPTIYGVVAFAETGALEAGRPLTAFGLDEAELLAQQPQIYELLATRFVAVCIAHSLGDGQLRPYLPPRPPRPHARVFVCEDAEVRCVFERLDFLRSLLQTARTDVSPDALVAAVLRGAWRAHNGSQDFLLRAGRELAALLPQEYDRLRALVGQITG